MGFLIISAAAVASGSEGAPRFQKAVGVWPKGETRQMNTFVGFRGDFEAKSGESALLRLVGWSAYRIYVNGLFVGYGPARGPNGEYRVDEWKLDRFVQVGPNAVAVEVAGYNARSFFCHSAPSFLRAEVVSGNEVRLATGPRGGFRAVHLPKIQKTNRYTYQRTFCEAYRVRPSDWNWHTGEVLGALELEETGEVPLLPRLAEYPSFEVFRPVFTGETTCHYDETVEVGSPSYMTLVDYDRRTYRMDGFLPSELEANVFAEIHRVKVDATRPVSTAALDIGGGKGALADVGRDETGFLGFTFVCRRPGRLIVTFDEILLDGRLDPLRMQASNGIVWDFLEPGVYRLENFEPNTFRYCHFFLRDGEGTVSELNFRTVKNPTAVKASFTSSDAALNGVFAAARESFAQNAVDVFTDCPSRERVGWLCDSFFISRTSLLLTGSVKMEDLFFENFARAGRFDVIDGMIQSSYPGDWINGNYYANWAMWFVIQLAEYAARGGDKAIVAALRPRCERLIEFFWNYRNMEGLLERVDGAILIEHSRASEFVQDVSYPLNMTWAGVLDAMARLYGRKDLAAEAERVREEIRRQSWNGTWFCDHAVRNDVGLRPYNRYELRRNERDISETCQYYAFFFGIATPESHGELWKRLVERFGPGRKVPDGIVPSAAFVGYYLRLECLSRAGLTEQVRREITGYFSPMAKRTGTLWEHALPTASCCHAFASHVAVSIVRDIVGATVDPVRRTVSLRETDTALDHCEVSLPVAEGFVKVGWKKRDGLRRAWKVSLPEGWKNLSEESEMMDFVDLLEPEAVFVDGAPAEDRVSVLPDGRVMLKGGRASCVRLVWRASFGSGVRALGGDWERTYGENAWLPLDGRRTLRQGWMPWYFLAHDGIRTDGYGVAVQPNAFAAWKATPDRLELTLDVRAGSEPVELGSRRLELCQLVSRRGEKELPFAAGRAFCRKMCPRPCLPKEPVYGYNDWYCAYGRNSATNFLFDAKHLIESMDRAAGPRVVNRPYIVADDGWELRQTDEIAARDERWASVCPRWGMPMDVFAARVREMGGRPGLWYRPFLVDGGCRAGVADLSNPRWERQIRREMARFAEWGMELVKIDFLTFDWSQVWGMCLAETPVAKPLPRWSDRSRTTAEVVKGLYGVMREVAGNKMILIGCNAIDHFAAGLFELQRTGDDTSGYDWARTRKMGPNTLGMRVLQNGLFYRCDADCVGLVNEGDIPWELNGQWLELVARSGTSLFVSWKRSLALEPQVRDALASAWRTNAAPAETAEPLDWFDTPRPRKWRFGAVRREFDW